MSGSGAPGTEIRIVKLMHAPPERVFRAFLDPELMREWIAPDDLDIDHISVDPRVGGLVEVRHSRRGVSTGKFEGRYVKIDPPRELVYRWAFVGTEPERGEYFDTLVRVRLVGLPSGETQLTVVHERLEELRRGAPGIYGRVTAGWENCLDKLDRAVGQRRADRR